MGEYSLVLHTRSNDFVRLYVCARVALCGSESDFPLGHLLADGLQEKKRGAVGPSKSCCICQENSYSLLVALVFI